MGDKRNSNNHTHIHTPIITVYPKNRKKKKPRYGVSLELETSCSRWRRRTKQRIELERLKGKPTKKPCHTGPRIVLGTVVEVHGNDKHSYVGHHENGNQPRSPTGLRIINHIGRRRDWVAPIVCSAFHFPCSSSSVFKIFTTHFLSLSLSLSRNLRRECVFERKIMVNGVGEGFNGVCMCLCQRESGRGISGF